MLPRLLLHNEPIVNVKQHKHVGLWFQSNLSWNYHINDCYTRAAKRLALLKTVKYKLSRRSLEKIYFTFIRPLFEYGDIVWAGASKKDLSKLDS